jgi:hypothetical protein
MGGIPAALVRALERLVDLHGDGNYLDCTLKLTFPTNPNGVYLLKGGGPDVWRKFGVPSCWRKPQGVIHGKRCGVTENIGAAARIRWREQQNQHGEKSRLRIAALGTQCSARHPV